MRLDQLNIIMGKIAQNIFCPKCKKYFHENEIELMALKGNEIEFNSYCSVCETKATILASVEPPKSLRATPRSMSLLSKKRLSPDTLKNISAKLKSTQHDVRELFRGEN